MTPDIRLNLAYTALYGTWGVIVQLAGDFMISRTFVYMLMKDLKEITEAAFGKCKTYLKESVKEKAITLILCLRLVGRCSIPSISQILKRLEISKYNSVGSVSRVLQFAGDSLPNTLVNEDGGVKLVIIASDEIFSHLRPILITVEPVSSVILRIELADSRKIAEWKDHWECTTLRASTTCGHLRPAGIYDLRAPSAFGIDRSGYIAIYLINDEGKSMSAAQKETLVNVIRQSDTFH